MFFLLNPKNLFLHELENMLLTMNQYIYTSLCIVISLFVDKGICLNYPINFKFDIIVPVKVRNRCNPIAIMQNFSISIAKMKKNYYTL